MSRHHNTTIFSSSRLFFRAWSGWSCFTGQLPGMCHLYTGGAGCARKQGQVQDCSLGAGWDEAGGRLGVGLVQHLTGERLVAMRSKSRRLAAWAVIAAWVIWADHRWIEAFVKNGLGPGWDGPGFAWAITVGRLWFPGSSGHQPRWLARRVCSVVFGGLRGTCVFFFLLRSFLAAEGPLTQGCFTGQPPGTDCFYIGQSPDVHVVGKV